MAQPRKTSERLLRGRREAYAANPEPFRKAARQRRRVHGVAINTRRRELAAEKRQRESERRAQAARDKLGREPRTLDEWFPTQAKFSDWAQVARTVGVSRRSMLDWRTGKHPAVRAHRRKLSEITGLACFADAANWKARERPARTRGEKNAVPLLAELVVRCGLATREVQRLRVSQIQTNGIQFPNGRLITFGEKWEEVSRASLNDWLNRAKPTDLLFFSRKPVDRGRPASGVWISRALGASGLRMRKGQAGRTRHFAGDFARLGSGKRFTDHLQRVHGLSKNGSQESLELFRQRKGLTSITLDSPENAFDLLFPGRGRPATKRELFIEAGRLHDSGNLSWPKIAQRLTPKEFAEDPRKAAEAVRQGVLRMRT